MTPRISLHTGDITRDGEAERGRGRGELQPARLWLFDPRTHAIRQQALDVSATD
jgi:hypothetical protein